MKMQKLKLLACTSTLLALMFACDKEDPGADNQLPKAEFEVDNTNPLIEETVTFSDKSVDGDGEIQSWLWNFGDNSTSSEQNPSHSYTAKGTYTVSLTVVDNSKGSASSELDITVTDPSGPNESPVASFNLEDTLYLTGVDVLFTNSSDDSDGTINSYLWDFGDGNRSEEENPAHSYGEVGVYSVELSVTDNLGAASTFTKTIYIGGVKWSFPVGAKIESTTPAIADDGTIFMAVSGKEGIANVHAINSDGTKKWDKSLGDIVRSSVTISDDGKTIYTHSYDDFFYALDASDGSTEWSYEIGSNAKYSTTALGADGSLYIGSQTDNVHALTGEGEEKWVFATNGDVNGSPAIGSDGTIYVHSIDDFLYAINPTDGSEKWKYEYGNWSGTALALDAQGTVYVTGEADAETGVIAAVSSSGSELWRVTTTVVSGGLSETGKIDQGGAVIGADGTVYVGTKGPELVALDPANGDIKWSYTKTGLAGIATSPAVDQKGNVYFGDDSGIFSVLDKNGVLRFEFNLGTKVWSSAAIGDDGLVYVGATQEDGTGLVYAIELYGQSPADSPWPMRHANRRHTSRL